MDDFERHNFWNLEMEEFSLLVNGHRGLKSCKERGVMCIVENNNICTDCGKDYSKALGFKTAISHQVAT